MSPEDPDSPAQSRDHPEAHGSEGPQSWAFAPDMHFPEDALFDAPASLPRDYEILGELGRGGMGVVYRARQISINRQVAIKVLANPAAASTSTIERFLGEVRRLAQLQHPNIVSILDAGRAGSSLFYVMALINGVSLESMILGERLKPTVILKIMLQVAQAISFSHEKGIIHRDLKPANILVDFTQWAYVADFGLARDVSPDHKLTLTGQILGTPAYMSPEQASGRLEDVVFSRHTPRCGRTSVPDDGPPDPPGTFLFQRTLSQCPPGTIRPDSHALERSSSPCLARALRFPGRGGFKAGRCRPARERGETRVLAGRTHRGLRSTDFPPDARTGIPYGVVGEEWPERSSSLARGFGRTRRDWTPLSRSTPPLPQGPIVGGLRQAAASAPMASPPQPRS